MLLFVSPQHVPRRWAISPAVGTFVRSTKQPVSCVCGNDLSPLVQGDLQAIPQRFHHTRPRGTRPPRAILGALLDCSSTVIGALERPQLGGGGFGIRVTEILLPGRRATVASSVA